MLFKLSLKNIKKSFKDYAIYFFTLILGVSIFYIFNSIESQTIMLNVKSSTREIIDLMINLLSGVSVFVSFVLGFLIIYASRFLIKRRKKEFGIYLTLGMSKRKISLILLFETIFIGIISLFVGLALGVILSQFMSILVANMFEADLTKFKFTFSAASCIKTLIYFGIMYLFVMIFNTISISKCKLISLLHGDKLSEQVKLKNPIICTIVFIISSIFLGYAYYLVTGKVEALGDATQIFKPIVIGAITTFLIFWSLSGLIIKIVTSFKNTYYKGLNSFVVRQISSKINTTVFSMSVICLMLFITICVLSSALSIKNSMTVNLKTLAPIDMDLSKKLNITEEDAKNNWLLTPNMIDDSKLTLRDTLSKMDFNPDTYLKDIVEIYLYESVDIKISSTLGTYYDECKSKYPFLRYEMRESLIKLSDYNAAASLLGNKELSLNNDEYIIVADYDGWIPMRNEGLKRNTEIKINDQTYTPKYQEVQSGFIHIAANHVNMGIIIVPDDALTEEMKSESIMLANYRGNKEETEDVILSLNNHSYNSLTSLTGKTKLALYESSIGLGAMVTFIGLYLGIIFLISSAAILALKELSESSDNKMRFRMLRKIGVDESMINRALFYQIAIFFMFPLLVAIIHSIFGIIFCNYILETIGNEKLLESIIMTSIFIVLIYGGYFIITYLCSKNIIKDKV